MNILQGYQIHSKISQKRKKNQEWKQKTAAAKINALFLLHSSIKWHKFPSCWLFVEFGIRCRNIQITETSSMSVCAALI